MTPLQILILDDDPARHAGFRAALSAHALTHAWTSTEATSRLHGYSNEPRFDAVLLDHDLGEFGEESLGTGLDVAREVALASPDRMPTIVVIHSVNPIGALKMQWAVEGRVPKLLRLAYGDDLLRGIAGWLEGAVER